MKFQDLLSLKNNEKKSRLSSAAIVNGALRVKRFFFLSNTSKPLHLFDPYNKLFAYMGT